MIDSRLARAYGTLAGFGFIGASLLALPSTWVLDPLPEPQAYFLTLAGILTGLVCLAVPWDRLDPWWLHLVGAAAIIEAAASVAVFGQPYVAFFFLIAVLAAYISPDVRSVALQLGLICVALFAPIAYGPEDARSSLHVALVAAPILVLTGGLFAYLRLKQAYDRRAYHRFAEQTLLLSSQIAGRPVPSSAPSSVPQTIPRLATVRPPRTLLGMALVAIAIPLFAGGLAAAGIRLPEIVNDPFEQVGIELPNQDSAEPAGAARAERGRRAREVYTAPERPAVHQERRRNTSSDESAPRREGEPAEAVSQATAPSATPPATSAPPTAVPDESGPTPGPPVDTDEIQSPLDDLLGEATDGLQGLLEGLGVPGQESPAEPGTDRTD